MNNKKSLLNKTSSMDNYFTNAERVRINLFIEFLNKGKDWEFDSDAVDYTRLMFERFSD